eukprot:1874911-Amphidinium_carterae.1
MLPSVGLPPFCWRTSFGNSFGLMQLLFQWKTRGFGNVILFWSYRDDADFSTMVEACRMKKRKRRTGMTAASKQCARVLVPHCKAQNLSKLGSSIYEWGVHAKRAFETQLEKETKGTEINYLYMTHIEQTKYYHGRENNKKLRTIRDAMHASEAAEAPIGMEPEKPVSKKTEEVRQYLIILLGPLRPSPCETCGSATYFEWLTVF